MATYRDYIFRQGPYMTVEEVIDTNAIVIAIKNIILSRPGNFPLTPSLGLDIEQYEFELADEVTLNSIKSNLNAQIAKFIPSVDNVFVDVRLVDDDQVYGRKLLGIAVKATNGKTNVNTNFLLYRSYDGLHIYNETREN